MKNTAGLRKTYFDFVREYLIENHPKTFDILLVLTLISLSALAVFLVSDILSYQSNTNSNEPFNGFDLQKTKDAMLGMMNWPEGTKDSGNPSAANSSAGEAKITQSAANKSNGAKTTLAATGNGSQSVLADSKSPSTKAAVVSFSSGGGSSSKSSQSSFLLVFFRLRCQE